MSQLEGSLALGSAPAFHGSPRPARARWAAAGLLIVLALSAIAALPQREARFESPGPAETAPGSQALSNGLGPQPASLAADTPAIALPGESTQPAPPAAAERRATDAYASLPLAFVPNAGQTDERVRYYAQGAGYGLYFTDHKAVLALKRASAATRSSSASSEPIRRPSPWLATAPQEGSTTSRAQSTTPTCPPTAASSTAICGRAST